MCLAVSGFCNAQRLDSTSKPVIKHQKGSKLPDVLFLKGNVMEVSYGYCGIFCMGATAKVKLANKIPRYPYLYVYLVVPCLETVLEDSSIQVRATKLFVKEKACYYNSIINTIDSKGVPFYKLNEKEAGKLKQRAHINGTLKTSFLRLSANKILDCNNIS